MRSFVVSGRLLLILAAVLLVPACSTQKRKNPPVIVFTSPASGASSVPRQPVIYIRYDKALDPSTVNSSQFLLADTVGTIACTVSYNPALFEVRMVPSVALGSSSAIKDYQVTVLAGVKSTEGAMVTVSLFFQFTTIISADSTRPTFLGDTTISTPSTQTSLTLNWTDGSDDVAIDHYDIFMSLSSGAEDLTNRFTTAGGTPAVVTGLTAGTTYYFIVRAVDAAGNTDLNTTEATAATLP